MKVIHAQCIFETYEVYSMASIHKIIYFPNRCESKIDEYFAYLCLNIQCSFTSSGTLLTLRAQMSCAHHDRDFIKQLESTTFTHSSSTVLCFHCLFDVMCTARFYSAMRNKRTCNVTFRFTQFERTFSVAIRALSSHYAQCIHMAFVSVFGYEVCIIQ